MNEGMNEGKKNMKANKIINMRSRINRILRQGGIRNKNRIQIQLIRSTQVSHIHYVEMRVDAFITFKYIIH